MLSQGSEYDISKAYEGHQNLIEAYSLLVGIKEGHLKVFMDLLRSSGGAQMHIDFVFLGLLNRSLNICDAILILVAKRNFIAAAPLLRIQIDTLLRLCYIETLHDSQPLAEAIMSGLDFRKIKDSQGRKLTDERLRDYARAKFTWIDDAYRSLSQLVHFSRKHIFLMLSPLSPENDFIINLRVGQPDELCPPSQVLILLESTAKVTREILRYTEGWIEWKNEHFKFGPVERDDILADAVKLDEQGYRSEARSIWEKISFIEKRPELVERIKRRLAEPDEALGS